MSQCLRAAESMFERHFTPPVMPVLKPKPAFGDINQTAMSPMERPAYPVSRSFEAHNAAAVQPISIQPRPSPNGHPVPSPFTSSPPVPVSLPVVLPSKKRGRPSKATREAWARAKASASQSGGYTPISPAPIAPSPAPPQLQRTYSPSPSAASAYQISPGNVSEPRPKKKARTTVAEKEHQTEKIPRSVQGSPEKAAQKSPGLGLGSGWHDNTWSVDQKQPGTSGPTPLEPPIQPQRPTAVDQPIHNPHPSLSMTGMPGSSDSTAAAKQPKTEGQVRVSSHA